MVRALAGDSTMTSRVPPLALFGLAAVPLSPVAAAFLLAALLFAGTLVLTSHLLKPPSRQAGLSPRSAAKLIASTIRGVAAKCPSLLLSLQLA